METRDVLLVLGVVCLLLGLADTFTDEFTTVDNKAVFCPEDKELLLEEIESCMKRGERYLHRYLKHVLNIGNRHFSMCSELERLRSCLEPLLLRCPAAEPDIHPDWHNIYRYLTCQCDQSTDCGIEPGCFESQFGGILSERCDEYYKFNVRQKTRDKCDFLYENVHCKEALVTSSCGEDAGILAFHMAKMFARRPLKQADCHFNRDRDYQGFRYNSKCRPDFTERLAACYRQHLKQDRLQFHQANDLVAQGDTDSLHLACKNYRAYQSCAENIEEACPLGIIHLYQYNERLRVYLFKMDVICQQNPTEYSTQMLCFGDALANQSMQECAPLWQKLEPQLKDVSAFQFFCLPDENKTQAINRDLASLRSCYEDIFSTSCPTGGPVMESLIRGAFQDPFYLQFKFQPDCDLHQEKKTPHSKHRHHRKSQVKAGQAKDQKSSEQKRKTEETKTSFSKVETSALARTSPCSLRVYIVTCLFFPFLSRIFMCQE